MKTASIGEVRRNLGRILESMAGGEEMAITNKGETVARLISASNPKNPCTKMPDVTKRLQKTFGTKVISEKAMKKIWNENRGN